MWELYRDVLHNKTTEKRCLNHIKFLSTINIIGRTRRNLSVRENHPSIGVNRTKLPETLGCSDCRKTCPLSHCVMWCVAKAASIWKQLMCRETFPISTYDMLFLITSCFCLEMSLQCSDVIRSIRRKNSFFSHMHVILITYIFITSKM